MPKTRKVPPQQGFDVIVWQHRINTPTWACGYTNPGTLFLQLFDSAYVQGRALEILATPESFYRKVPGLLKVGVVNPETKQTHKLVLPHLH